ncbi:MAG: RES domain-containing protein [Prolixibacteraceae bacterium]
MIGIGGYSMLKYEFDSAFIKSLEDIDKLDLTISSIEENLIVSELMQFKLLHFAFNKVIPYLQRLTINKKLPNINNETITKLDDLKNPPDEIVKKLNRYGRANLKNQSVLYASFILPTLIKETNPDVGDLVTISRWKVKNEETPLIVSPIIDYTKCKDYQLRTEFEKALSQLPNELQKITFQLYCLTAKHFGKYVERGKDINYIFSAHFADKIFHEIYDGKIEAIIYPSVQDSGATSNIALKPDVFNEKYEIDEITECLVVSNYDHALFLKTIKSTLKVDSSGIIIWG